MRVAGNRLLFPIYIDVYKMTHGRHYYAHRFTIFIGKYKSMIMLKKIFCKI